MLVEGLFHHPPLPRKRQQSRSFALRAQDDTLLLVHSPGTIDDLKQHTMGIALKVTWLYGSLVAARDFKQRLFANCQLLIAYSYLSAITGSKRAAFTAG